MKKRLYFILFGFYNIVIKSIFYVTGIKNGRSCRFHPTCSVYARECFIKYPATKAFVKTLKRILKCHPWSSGGVDLS